MMNFKRRLITCLLLTTGFCMNANTYAQLPNLEKDEAIVPMSSSQIKHTFQSREFEGAYPGTILGKSEHHFDRKFLSGGDLTHVEYDIKTAGRWEIRNNKMCFEFKHYLDNKCYRIYEMGNCFYFYEEYKTDTYLLGREYDRWDTRLVPKREDGLCRVFVYKKVPGQAPILISPIY